MQEEADLIDKAQAGDREAVNALVALHWQPLYRFLAYKVGDREEAKELSQETWLRLVRALPQYRQNGASFKSFLYRIAGNLVVDHWRKNGRKPVLVELEAPPSATFPFWVTVPFSSTVQMLPALSLN